VQHSCSFQPGFCDKGEGDYAGLSPAAGKLGPAFAGGGKLMPADAGGYKLAS
jgi:hypothetical protein